VNGAAARNAAAGDLLIIAAYSIYSEAELSQYAPRLIYVDANNRILDQRSQIPVQMLNTPSADIRPFNAKR
jgi:aspartate 1-decarboxylase